MRIYLLLALSIALEAVGTTSMKLSEGFSHLVPSLVVILGYGGALVAYIYLATRIELGVIYAIWSGAGTMLIAAIGVLAFGEAATPVKLLGLALIVCGVFGLDFQSSGRSREAR